MIVTVATLAGGCGTSARQSAASEHPAPSQPRLVRAGRITNGPFRSIKQGTAVHLQASEPRAFADATHGFSLFDSRSGETFPVATTDGGRVWRIVGPVLHAPAAQGPLAVSEVGVAGPRTYMAYGDGSVVDVTTDAGRHWWRAALGDEVPAVVASGRQLTAFAQRQVPNSGETLGAVTWVYSSTDGGRTWRADDLLAPP